MPDLHFQVFSSSALAAERWAFPQSADEAAFAAMTRQSLRLGDIANVFTGITTGADKAFFVKIVRRDGKRALIHSRASDDEHWVELARLRPVLRSRDVFRYKPIAANTWLVATHDDAGQPLPEKELREKWPLTYSYLLAVKGTLADRNKGSLSAQPRYAMSGASNYPRMLAAKILNGWRFGKPQFSIDGAGGLYFAGGGNSAGVMPKDNSFPLTVLLGVLNSSTVEAYMRTISPERWAGVVYSTNRIKSIPMVSMTATSAPIYAAIGETVERILAPRSKSYVDNGAVDTLEADVDVLVRRLYNME